MSQELMQRIGAVLEKAYLPERHTYFQLKNFVVGKEPTIQAQLWQVARELRSRKETIDSLTVQFEDSEDMLELAEIGVERVQKQYLSMVSEHADITPDEASLRLREMRVNVRQAERRRDRIEASIKALKLKMQYVLEEATYLVGAFDALSKVEPMKPLDDVPAQKQYWNEKFHEELKLRMLLGRPLDSDFVRTVMALDEDSPVKRDMMGILHSAQRRLADEVQRDDRAAMTQIGG